MRCRQITLFAAALSLVLVASTPCRAQGPAPGAMEAFQQELAAAPPARGGGVKYCLGVNYCLHDIGAWISYVRPNSPADGVLQQGDWVLITVYRQNAQVQVKPIGCRYCEGFVSLRQAVQGADSRPFGMLIVRNGVVQFVVARLEPCP